MIKRQRNVVFVFFVIKKKPEISLSIRRIQFLQCHIFFIRIHFFIPSMMMLPLLLMFAVLLFLLFVLFVLLLVVFILFTNKFLIIKLPPFALVMLLPFAFQLFCAFCLLSQTLPLAFCFPTLFPLLIIVVLCKLFVFNKLFKDLKD